MVPVDALDRAERQGCADSPEGLGTLRRFLRCASGTYAKYIKRMINFCPKNVEQRGTYLLAHSFIKYVFGSKEGPGAVLKILLD